jgi:hypothetical protein
LRQACRENEQAALSKGIGIHMVSCDATILSDSLLLGAALRNLVGNAIKYTQAGGRILVGCRHSRSGIRIDVYDTGTGIPGEQIPKIFEAFTRLDAAQCDGLGIGLFIVRQALGILGHRIDVASTPAAGLAFPFSSRARDEAETERGQAPRKKRKGRAIRRKLSWAAPTQSVPVNGIGSSFAQKRFPFLIGMNHIAGSRLPPRRGMGDGAAASFTAQEGRRQMINGFTLHETTTAPAASAEILNGILKGWGFVPNLHRILAESPAALEAYSTLWGMRIRGLEVNDSRHLTSW